MKAPLRSNKIRSFLKHSNNCTIKSKKYLFVTFTVLRRFDNSFTKLSLAISLFTTLFCVSTLSCLLLCPLVLELLFVLSELLFSLLCKSSSS